MNIDLWISVALAIPLAVVANILTPKIQNRFDTYLQNYSKVRTKQKIKDKELQLTKLQQEILELKVYRDNKAEFNNVLLIALIKIAIYGAMLSLYNGMFFALKYLSIAHVDLGKAALDTLSLFVQLSTLVVAVIIFNTCSKSLRTYSKVKNFADYENKSKLIIKQLEEDIHNSNRNDI